MDKNSVPRSTQERTRSPGLHISPLLFFFFYIINVRHGLSTLSQPLPLCRGADSLETKGERRVESIGYGNHLKRETSARVDAAV